MSIEKNNIKAVIDANVKQNGNNEITGQVMNAVLTAMNEAALKGYHFQGILTANTTLPTNSPYFYLAVGALTYNSWTWVDGEIGYLAYSNETGATPQKGTIARIDLMIGAHNSDVNSHPSILNEIDSINDLIPAQASQTNKLADKDFVNSSINSSAAFFRGTYADQLALLTVAWQTNDPDAQYYVSNNDYAYVEEVVAGSSLGNWNPADHLGEAWRFIYVEGSGWEPQFKVNDTPFTAAQLAAINSGITVALVGQITTNKNGKADKVSGATNGNLAGLNASGNLTDSGIAASNVMQKVSGATAGDAATLDASGNIRDSGVQLSSLARDNEVVHFAQAETVTGVKNFSNGLQIGGQSIVFDSVNQCLEVVSDTLIQGDLQVNGEINGKTIATDDNAKIIEVAKVLDLSAVNNEVQIDLPSGYVCNPTALGSGACIGIYSYDDKTSAWSTDATVQISTVEAQVGTTVSSSETISHGLMRTKGLVPFCKTYIRAKVTTAAVGTSPKALIHATIFCKKISISVESYIEGYTNAAFHTIHYSLDGGNTYQGVTSDADAYFRIDLPSAPTTLEKLFYPGDNDERRENFSIVSINFSHVADSSHITNMAWMCKNLNELASVNLNGLQAAKPTDIGQIFNSCEALTALDMSMLDTSHVTASVTNHGFATMLYGCTALETVKLPQFPSTAYIGSSPFGMCSALTTISQCGTIATDKFHVNESPLTRASALVLIIALADKTGGTAGTLKLSASTLALLSQNDIAIANGKNWNVTS